MRRGQISTFVILGILLFAVVGFLYVPTKTSQKNNDVQKQKVDTAIISEVALSNFISSCVEQSAKESIEHIGLQGGRIFPTEENSTLFGLHPFLSANLPLHGKASQINVSYNSLALMPALLPPQYPCGSQVPYAINQYTYCGFVNDMNKFSSLNLIKLGLPNMLPLCKSKKECNFEEVSVGEKTISLAGPFSIQEQLEESIKKKLYDCVDIEKLEGYNSSFTAQKVSPNVALSFEDKAVRISVSFPINISLQGKEPYLILAPFHIDIPLRLKNMYKFIRYAIEKDNADLYYNIKNDVQNPYAKTGFTTELVSAGSDVAKGDYIVRVSDTDPSYGLYGQPFVFEYVVKNRPPVLEYVPLSDPAIKGVFNPSVMHDIEVIEGDAIKMYISAVDPDDTQNDKNNLKIFFSGWKKESFEKNYNLQTGYTSYKTIVENHEDLGEHTVRVSASDGIFTDYQDVRMLVNGKASASIGGYYNSLTGQKEKLSGGKITVSYEDKSVFYPSSIIESSNDFEYSWTLDGEKVQINDVPTEYVVQEEIKNNDPEKSPFKNKDGKIIFSVTSKSPSQNNAAYALTLDIQRCISNKNSNVYSYPYNKLKVNNHVGSTDPFVADKPCCLNNNYAPSSTSCFSYVKYGCYNTLKKEYFDVNGEIKKIFNHAGKLVNPSSFPDITSDKKNDIYKMEIMDKCTGNRGNICSGNPKGSLSQVSPYIPDFETGETERCSLGCRPDKVYDKENDAKISSSVNFGVHNEQIFKTTHEMGENSVPWTYEKYLNLKDKENKEATGICNKNWKKSSGFGNVEFTTSLAPFICQSTCGNNGCNFAINCVCGDPTKDKTTGDFACAGVKEADIFASTDKKAYDLTKKVKCNKECKITS